MFIFLLNEVFESIEGILSIEGFEGMRIMRVWKFLGILFIVSKLMFCDWRVYD